MPKGVAAPGNTKPGGEVPIIGSTKLAGSGSWPRADEANADRHSSAVTTARELREAPPTIRAYRPAAIPRRPGEQEAPRGRRPRGQRATSETHRPYLPDRVRNSRVARRPRTTNHVRPRTTTRRSPTRRRRRTATGSPTRTRATENRGLVASRRTARPRPIADVDVAEAGDAVAIEPSSVAAPPAGQAPAVAGRRVPSRAPAEPRSPGRAAQAQAGPGPRAQRPHVGRGLGLDGAHQIPQRDVHVDRCSPQVGSGEGKSTRALPTRSILSTFAPSSRTQRPV